MSLQRLPQEIVYQIVDYIFPDALENFALTSKHAYDSCSTFIERHNNYRRLYRDVWFDEPEKYFSTSVQLLDRISKDPHIAWYVESADLGGIRRQRVTNRNFYKGGDKLPSKVKALIHCNHYLHLAKIDANIWCRQIARDFARPYREADEVSEDLYSAALVLTLLPNLRRVTLPREWYQGLGDEESSLDEDPTMAFKTKNNVAALMRTVCDVANSGEFGASLAKLRTVLPRSAGGIDDWKRLDTLIPFLKLKSLRQLYAGSCCAVNPSRYAKLWQHIDQDGCLGLNLEELELQRCVIRKAEMATLLKDMRHLRVLRFSYEEKGLEIGTWWNAASFIEAIIESPVVKTLEELSLDCYESRIGWFTDGIKSLRAFQRLKKLELSLLYMNVSPPLRNEVEDDSDPVDPTQKGYQCPNLLELIPKSLESLLLVGSQCPPHAETLKRLFVNADSSFRDRVAVLVSIGRVPAIPVEFEDDAGWERLRTEIQASYKNVEFVAGTGTTEFMSTFHTRFGLQESDDYDFTDEESSEEEGEDDG